MLIKEFTDNYLSSLFNALNRENKDLVLMGDFNINLMNNEFDLLSQCFLDVLGSLNCILQITLPTRVTNQAQLSLILKSQVI